MTDRLIIQSGDDAVAHYLDRAQVINTRYAHACGALYWRHDGRWDPATPPAWNRLPMMLDAFEHGFEQVLWLDADTLAVDDSVDVFEEAMWDHEGRGRCRIGEVPDPTGVPFVMRRTAGGFYWPMDGADQWEGWNDGVLLVNRSEVASSAIALLWECRNQPPKPWHQPTLWELNWLLDYAKAHPEHVAEMDQRFNWQPFNGSSPEQYAVIKAWHGLPHKERWEQLDAAASALEMGERAVANVRDTTPGFVGE